MNLSVMCLSPVGKETYSNFLYGSLMPKEEILEAYHGFRACVIFTTKKIIVITFHRFAKRTKDIHFFPYKKIQAYSIAPPSLLDPDEILVLWLPGIGKVKLGFSSPEYTNRICKLISSKIKIK